MSPKAITLSQFITGIPTTCQTAATTTTSPSPMATHTLTTPNTNSLLLTPLARPSRPYPRTLSLSWASHPSPCRTISSSWATRGAVSLAFRSLLPTLAAFGLAFSVPSFHADLSVSLFFQLRRELIRRSKWWGMARSAPSGSVIGMGRYRPIRPCLPCNAARVQSANMQASASSPSRG